MFFLNSSIIIILTSFLATILRHHVNLSVLMQFLARPFLRGSQNPWLVYQPSGPTTNNLFSLQITRAELIATSYAIFPVLPLTVGLQ